MVEFDQGDLVGREALAGMLRDMSPPAVITIGGAPEPRCLVRRVRDRSGCHSLSTFGQTEHSPVVCYNPVEASLEGIAETAGQPLPRTEVSIRSPGGNQIMPLSEVIAACIRPDRTANPRRSAARTMPRGSVAAEDAYAVVPRRLLSTDRVGEGAEIQVARWRPRG